MRRFLFVLSSLALVACSSNAAAPPGPGGGADGGASATLDGGAAAPASFTGACAKVPALLEAASTTLASEVAKAHATGGSVAILCGGAIAAKPVGTVKSGGAPVRETTRFQLASITKSFTAVAATSLALEGRVALDAPITTYVPFVDPTYPGATPYALTHLLSHTAGYPVDIPNANDSDDTLEGWFKNNGSAKPWSPPGAVFDYSNLGYALAGLALQRAAATPFADLIAARVFQPAGMTGARMSATALMNEGDFAYGNSEGQTLGPLDSYYQSEQYAPMGGAWASAVDLASYGRALAARDPKVLPAAGWAQLLTPRTKTDEPGRSYGYGVFIDAAKHAVYSHSGSVQGFTSSYDVVADAGVGVFVLANGDNVDTETLSQTVLTSLVDVQPEVPADVGSADDWVGTYQDPVRLGTVTITKSGAGYAATWSGSTKTLTPSYGDVASYPDPTYGQLPASFWRGASGKVEWLITTEGHARRN